MNRLEEISAMIENHRQRGAISNIDERSAVDAFNDTISGIHEYFEVLHMHENEEISRVARVGVKLVREAFDQMQRICDVLDVAIGEIKLLYTPGNSNIADADCIVDAKICGKYIIPKGVNDNVITQEGKTH